MVCLVIGGKSGVGKRTLVSKVPQDASCGLGCFVVSDSVWRVDNKYFTADVDIHVVEVPEDLTAQKDSCEGLILVFDMNDNSTFQMLEQWVPFIEDVDPAALVCVANKADLVADSPDETVAKWQDWCLDKGMELVVCSALKDRLEQSRDAEGLVRIFEAISSHTWTGYSMKGNEHAGNGSEALLSGEILNDAAANSHNGSLPTQCPEATIDYSKFDGIVDEDEDEPKRERIRLEDLPRPRGQLVQLALDPEVQSWLQENAPSEEESEVLADLLTQLRAPDVRIGKFFLDGSLLGSMEVGPNCATHVNQEEALPKIATSILRTHQVVKDTPTLLRLGVRYSVWGSMSAGGARLPELLPLAVAWCQLESCAAETTVGFYKRVTLSREALAGWVDEAVVPAVLRCLQPESAPSDYLRELLASAGELKEGGNAMLKDGRLADAARSYGMAIKILEQLFVQRVETKAAARPDRDEDRTPPSQFTVETVEVASGQAVGPDGWPRFLLREASELTAACHLNSAAVALKQPRQHHAAVQHCTYALALDPRNPKAYYRRGMAFMASPGREEGVASSAAAQTAAAEGGGGREEGGGEGGIGVGGPGREEPPREVLLSWAVRDLERAKELVEGRDGMVDKALCKAKAAYAELTRARLKAEGGEGLLEEVPEEGGEDDKDLTQIIDKLRAARADGQGMSDAQRRERAAAAAKQAAAFLGMEDEGDGSDTDQ